VILRRACRRWVCIQISGVALLGVFPLQPSQPDPVLVNAEMRPSWLGPPLRILMQREFEAACAQLMRLVEQDYAPALIVGVRTGGLVVAECMARHSSSALPVLPVTSRRASTNAKARIPLFRATLSALPRPAVNLLRRVEHKFLIAPRAHQQRAQLIDHGEVEEIAATLARGELRSRLLVADDAVDSGVTLATVVNHLAAACPAGTEIRTAVITQTLDQPAMRPHYALYQNTLCRFPWSFDAKR
jgi:uncharacterized protein